MEDAEVAFAGVARQAELVHAGEVSPRELVDLHLVTSAAKAQDGTQLVS